MSRIPTNYRLSPIARRFRMHRGRAGVIPEPQVHDTLVGDVLHSAAVETVFDIHPHSCATGILLRQCGYRGRIVSFEPRERYWEQLHYCSMTDDEWLLSRSAIRLSDDVELTTVDRVPIVGTRLASAIDVFCEEDEVLAVWLSNPEDGVLLDDIVSCKQVRVLNTVCLISAADSNTISVERMLHVLRNSGWDVISVNSRHDPDEHADHAAYILAVRLP
ncbi:MAG: hypothetical protein N2663_04835 [Chlorobi bacterium]|nr:hypothetical protein [Chlorobiota bacterium]